MIFTDKPKGFHFNKHKELILQISDEQTESSDLESKKEKKRPGFKGAMKDCDKVKEFEPIKDNIYDLKNKKMRGWGALRETFERIGKSYRNERTNKIMSTLNVWSVAKRYGEEKGYICSQPTKSKERNDEDIDPDYGLNPTGTVIINNPKNAVWIVDISAEECLQQKTSKNVYQRGMAAALKLEFFRIFECSCQIEFRNITSTDKELHAMAYCKECPGEVEYQSFSGRAMLQIKVQKFDFNKEHSTKKTKVTGTFKTKILKMLEADQPGIVQAKLANEMIMNFSTQSPLVPHKRSLRQIKYREANRKREFRDKNPVLSICKMKNEAKYYKCIEDVGISPFFVYYTTPLQKVFVKSESRKNTTKISIDATGCSSQLSEEAEISERTGKKSDVFFII